MRRKDLKQFRFAESLTGIYWTEIWDEIIAIKFWVCLNKKMNKIKAQMDVILRKKIGTLV